MRLHTLGQMPSSASADRRFRAKALLCLDVSRYVAMPLITDAQREQLLQRERGVAQAQLPHRRAARLSVS